MLRAKAHRLRADGLLDVGRDDVRVRYRGRTTPRSYDDATLDDLREAVETLEDAGHTARRVLGGAHPVAADIELSLRDARAALRARETPSPGDA